MCTFNHLHATDNNQWRKTIKVELYKPKQRVNTQQNKLHGSVVSSDVQPQDGLILQHPAHVRLISAQSSVGNSSLFSCDSSTSQVMSPIPEYAFLGPKKVKSVTHNFYSIHGSHVLHKQITVSLLFLLKNFFSTFTVFILFQLLYPFCNALFLHRYICPCLNGGAVQIYFN